MDSTRLVDIFFSVILPVLITTVGGLWLGRKQSKTIQVDIEAKYKAMLDSEIDKRGELSARFDKLEKEFDTLEKELKRYMRAYEHSLYHIRHRYLVPEGEDAPDFLDWDSTKLRKYYNEKYGSD